MYFKLISDTDEMSAFVEPITSPFSRPPIRGVLEETELSSEFMFSFDDLYGQPPADFYDADVLMSAKMLSIMRAAGFDNFQAFPARLVDKDRRDLGGDRYCVVNVVGLVCAEDESASESLPLGEGKIFTKLRVNQKNAGGLLVFRLAESLVDVIVHDRIASALRSADLRGIRLERA